MNWNNPSVTLDLTHLDGVPLLMRPVADADAAVENYRAEVLRKLGLDLDLLKQVNSVLVMLSPKNWSD